MLELTRRRREGVETQKSRTVSDTVICIVGTVNISEAGIDRIHRLKCTEVQQELSPSTVVLVTLLYT